MAATSRFAPDSPELIAARQDHSFAQLAQLGELLVTRAAELDPVRRARLAQLLAPVASEGTA